MKSEFDGVQPTSRGALASAGALETFGGSALGCLVSMTWLHFLNDGAVGYLSGVLPAVLADLNIPVGLAGTMMGALLAGQALQPFCGWISDRIGGRGFVLTGVGISAVCGALMGVAPGYSILVIILLLIGVASAMFHPQALAVVRESAPGNHGFHISMFLVGGELGRGVWPLMASLVVVTLGLKSLLLLALPAILTLPVVAGQVPPLTPRHPALAPIQWARHLPDITRLVSYSGLRATMMYSLMTFLPLLWVERGGSLVGGASLITVLLMAGIAGSIGGGYCSDRIGRKVIILAATGLSGLLLALLLITPTAALWLVLAALGMSVFATLPLQILIGQDILPGNRSLGSGLALGLSNALGALALSLLGWLASAWSINAALWANVALSFAAMGIAAFLP